MAGLFNERFTIFREGTVSYGEGRTGRSFSQVGSTMGRLSATSLADSFIAGADAQSVAYKFACSAKADIQAGDKLAGAGGREVIVQAVKITSSGRRLEAIATMDRATAGGGNG